MIDHPEAALRRRIIKLERALQDIVDWNPPAVRSSLDGTMRSLSSEWGSSGERDYFRNLAQEALNG